ncbi:hypothetical protein OCGS_0576 [Oceaniovalibus guishaninsula JLT2003]|uniref:DUF4177 domain-containing protein n=1 Tax=Oceaniovalibus guishaninsula JLT2003 TaxID=1231392 RepID=K2GSA3_9RHOB|nr:hypothetical protein [Oceaniovalibus guishaninsula]EKE45486.1 hypothetical protein OCGS_0576 [Oceaniovalibus guishaninsula JLT2003]
MSHYQYRVVPAPRVPARIKGVKRIDQRFARTLADTLNALAPEGWEFHRAETMPVEARRSFLGTRQTRDETMLVFRRWIEDADMVPVPSEPAPAPRAVPEEPDRAVPTLQSIDRRQATASASLGAPNRRVPPEVRPFPGPSTDR